MRFLIIIFDIFNYTARIADSYGIGRNIFHDNTACSDDRVFTDGHTRKDCRAASYPYTIFYKDGAGNCVADGRSGTCPFRHPFREVNGMSSGIYFYIGGYHHVVTDNDIVIIEERAVHVHDHLVPEIDVFPILASEVYVDVNILADTSEHLPIDALLCLIVGIIRFSELV
jgi:hypothetical protein